MGDHEQRLPNGRSGKEVVSDHFIGEKQVKNYSFCIKN